MFLDSNTVTTTGKPIILFIAASQAGWHKNLDQPDKFKRLLCWNFYIILLCLNFSQPGYNNLPHTATAGLNCDGSVSFTLMETA